MKIAFSILFILGVVGAIIFVNEGDAANTSFWTGIATISLIFFYHETKGDN